MYEEITPAEFVAECGTGTAWQLLDVREPWEIEIASVPQSIHIPMAEVPARQSELATGDPIAVLCHSGGRSARVAQFLSGQGFCRVANIAGGISAWAEQVDSSLSRY